MTEDFQLNQKTTTLEAPFENEVEPDRKARLKKFFEGLLDVLSDFSQVDSQVETTESSASNDFFLDRSITEYLVEGLGKDDTEEVEGEQELTLAKAKSLLFFSFYFSQGNEGLHEAIFRWLHARYPHYILDEEAENKLYHMTLPAMQKVVPTYFVAPPEEELASGSYHQTHLHSDARDSLKKEIHNMGTLLNGPQADAHALAPIIVTMIKKIIHSDYRYIVASATGRRRTEHDPKVPMKDKYLSHFCKYLVEGDSTGVTEYDAMFLEMREFIQKNYQDLFSVEGTENREQTEELFRVVKMYRDTHK